MLRKAKIAYNFGLSECKRVNDIHTHLFSEEIKKKKKIKRHSPFKCWPICSIDSNISGQRKVSVLQIEGDKEG